MKEAEETLVILNTCNPSQASKLARQLVQSGLVPCVNEIPGIRSANIWSDAVQQEQQIYSS